MGIATKAGDWSFKAFTAGLGLATIYLTTTFSVNVYRGLSWHKAQSVCRITSVSVDHICILSRINRAEVACNVIDIKLFSKILDEVTSNCVKNWKKRNLKTD